MDGVVEYRLIYSDQLTPAAKVDVDGNVIEEYVYGTGVNSPDYIKKDGINYRVIKDHLGSTRMVVNASTGDLVKTITYDEFGNATNETGDFDILFGYAGGLRDTDTGLIKFGARDYDPETGRWTSKEPLGFEGALNFYSYCDADPVNFNDPTGLEKRPLSSEFWKAYPNYNDYDTAEKIWELVGGSLGKYYINADDNDSCATRASYALNESGYYIPAWAPGANRNYKKGENPTRRYILSAVNFDAYLKKAWGDPDKVLSKAGDQAKLISSLKEGQVAILVANWHVSIVKKDYQDQFIPTYGNVWILPMK